MVVSSTLTSKHKMTSQVSTKTTTGQPVIAATAITTTNKEANNNVRPVQKMTALLKKNKSNLSSDQQQQPSSSRLRGGKDAAVPKKVRKSVSTEDRMHENGQSAKKSGTKSTTKLEKLKLQSSALIANGKLKSSSVKAVPNKIMLNTINPHITCNLCKGYLIDATTIVECLHSFCHSCIMRHLRQEQYCPSCEMMINKTKPNIKPDATLQAIVYKLVPELYEKELLRRREFYRKHPEDAKLTTPEQRGEDTENLIFSPSEKISLSIEYADKECFSDLDESLKSSIYLECSAVFTVNMLRKFVVMKYEIDNTQFCVDIMYKVKTIVLSDYYTLMDVAYIYTWKREAPMKFFFRVRTKEMSAQELPEVPLRRSPSISTAVKPIIPCAPIKNEEVEQVPEDKKDVQELKPVMDISVNNSSEVDKSVDKLRTAETSYKLVKKVDPQHSGSDNQKLVYTFKPTQPRSSESHPKLGDRSSSAKINKKGYEKGHSKLKRLIQKLSDERKISKQKKKELSSNSTSDSAKKCEKLKLKITKNNSGVMVIQNSSSIEKDKKTNPDAPLDIDKVGENDELKKSLFLNSIQLTARKTDSNSVSAASDKTASVVSKKQPEVNEKKEKISFGFSSYQFENNVAKIDTPPIRSSTPNPPALPEADKTKVGGKSERKTEETGVVTKENKTKKQSESPPAKKIPPSDPNVSPQNLPRRKFSNYVKIAPKEPVDWFWPNPKSKPPPKVAPRKPNVDVMPNVKSKVPTSAALPSVTIIASPTITNVITTGMNPPPTPPRQTSNLSDVYAFLHSNQKLMTPPPQKQLYKPHMSHIPPNMHFANQFQTMPSPVYLPSTGCSTPIYSPNSPQYAPNFNFPQQQHFKYAKMPSYMTNFALPKSELGKKDAKPKATTNGQNNKGVNYLNKLPPPPIFCAPSSSTVSVTMTTSSVSNSTIPNHHNSGTKRKIESDSRPQSQREMKPKDEHSPEKQSKVQSLLDSCNITFPSSLSITITNENSDSDKSGSQSSKLMSPVNNYIEILKIPSGELSDSNNRLPLPVSSAMPIKNTNFLPPPPTTSSSSKSPPARPLPPTSSKQQQQSSMSITPAITANLLQSKCNELLIKKQNETESGNGLKRKFSDPSLEVTPINVGKRKSVSPPTTQSSEKVQPIEPSVNHQRPLSSSGPKQLPSLNPIEKNKPNSPPVKVACSLATNKSADSFQKELLKFVNDLKNSGRDGPPIKKDTENKKGSAKSGGGENGKEEKPKSVNKRKNSPPKTKMECANQINTTSNKVAPIPKPLKALPSPLHHQQQEFTAAIMKMAFDMQTHQQKIAMPQQQYPISNLLTNNFMIPNAAAMAAAAATAAILNSGQSQPQLVQQQQLNNLIQQACLMEHFQRMKKAGSDALEQIAQNLQHQKKAVSPKIVESIKEKPLDNGKCDRFPDKKEKERKEKPVENVNSNKSLSKELRLENNCVEIKQEEKEPGEEEPVKITKTDPSQQNVISKESVDKSESLEIKAEEKE